MITGILLLILIIVVPVAALIAIQAAFAALKNAWEFTSQSIKLALSEHEQREKIDSGQKKT